MKKTDPWLLGSGKGDGWIAKWPKNFLGDGNFWQIVSVSQICSYVKTHPIVHFKYVKKKKIKTKNLQKREQGLLDRKCSVSVS